MDNRRRLEDSWPRGVADGRERTHAQLHGGRWSSRAQPQRCMHRPAPTLRGPHPRRSAGSSRRAADWLECVHTDLAGITGCPCGEVLDASRGSALLWVCRGSPKEVGRRRRSEGWADRRIRRTCRRRLGFRRGAVPPAPLPRSRAMSTDRELAWPGRAGAGRECPAPPQKMGRRHRLVQVAIDSQMLASGIECQGFGDHCAEPLSRGSCLMAMGPPDKPKRGAQTRALHGGGKVYIALALWSRTNPEVRGRTGLPQRRIEGSSQGAADGDTGPNAHRQQRGEGSSQGAADGHTGPNAQRLGVAGCRHYVQVLGPRGDEFDPIRSPIEGRIDECSTSVFSATRSGGIGIWNGDRALQRT